MYSVREYKCILEGVSANSRVDNLLKVLICFSSDS